MKHHTRRDLLRAGVALGALLLAASAFGQGKQNQVQTGLVDAHGASWRFPESTFAGLPAAAAGNLGWRYTVTDCATSACTSGGGSTKADVRSNGSSYDVISGGGGGGISQPNSLGSGGGTPYQRALDCNTGSISLSGSTWTYPGGTVAGAAAATQEFTIITALNGNQRYDHALVSEHVQFAGSVSGVKVSIGRPGSTTNDEILPQTALMVSTADAFFSQDRPQPPTLGASNTYTLVVALRTTGGNVSALTAGAINYEVCGYAAQ